MKISRIFLSLSFSLLLLPTVALLPGCSGGNSGSTRTPVIPSSFEAKFPLGMAQTGKLNCALDGLSLSGQLVVANGGFVIESNDANPKTAKPSQVSGSSLNLPNGTYPISGTFVPPRGFSITATLPAPIGDIALTGQLPSRRRRGGYTITQVSTGLTISGPLVVTG